MLCRRNNRALVTNCVNCAPTLNDGDASGFECAIITAHGTRVFAHRANRDAGVYLVAETGRRVSYMYYMHARARRITRHSLIVFRFAAKARVVARARSLSARVVNSIVCWVREKERDRGREDL